MADFGALIAQLERGRTDDALMIDICLALDLAPKEWNGSKVDSFSWAGGTINTADGWRHLNALRLPRALTSLEAAIALVETMVPGCFYLIGKGKTRPDEPIFGAEILFGRMETDEVLGDGECDHSLQHALMIALLHALEAQKAAGNG